MIRLLTGLPRNTGVGEFTAQCALAIGNPVEIYYRTLLTPEQYESKLNPSKGILSEALYYAKIRSRIGSAPGRTHVVWEGFGTVFGKKTRLLSVHHVILPDDKWARNPDAPLSKRIAYRMALRAYRQIAEDKPKVIVPSNSTRDALIHGYGLEEGLIDVVPNAVDTEFYSPGSRSEARRVLSLPSDSFVVLRVSGDDSRKNSKCVGRAWQEMGGAPEGRHLIQVGPSPYLRALFAEGRLRDVRFYDSVSKETLRLLYRAADVLFHPTFAEGFSFVVLEAMSCGTPVIVSDIPLFQEELGSTLMGAPPEDATRFGRLLLEVRRGGCLQSAASLRHTIVEKFSRSRFRERLLSAYRGAGLFTDLR